MAVNRHKIQRTVEKFLRQGKVEQAIQQLQLILQDNPGETNTINRIGDLYARIGNKTEACRYYSQLADKYGSDGFYLKAIAINKKISKIDPSQIEVNRKLAELYSQQGLKNESKSQYVLVSDYHIQKNERPQAIEAIQKVLELDPDNIKYRAKLADLYTKEGAVHEAMAAYAVIADSLTARGMQDEALKVLKKAIKLEEGHPAVSAALGRLLLQQNKPKDAAVAIKKAMAENPEDPALLKVSVDINLAVDRQDQARSQLETLSSITPDDTGVMRQLKELSSVQAPAPAVEASEDAPRDVPEVDLTMEELNHVSGEWAVPDLVKDSDAFGGLEIGGEPAPSGGEVFDFGVSEHMVDREREEFINEHLTEADVFLKYGLIDKAIDQLEQIVAHYPDTPAVLRKLKDNYLEKGDKAAAAERCRTLAALVREQGNGDEAAALESEAQALASEAGVALEPAQPAPSGQAAAFGMAPQGASPEESHHDEYSFGVESASEPGEFELATAQPAAREEVEQTQPIEVRARQQTAPKAASPAAPEEFVFSLDEELEAPAQPEVPVSPGGGAEHEEGGEVELVIDIDGEGEGEKEDEDEFQMKEITAHGHQFVPPELLPNRPADMEPEVSEFSLDEGEEEVEFFDSAIKAAEREPIHEEGLEGDQEVLAGEENEVFEEEKDFMDLASSLEKEMAEMQSSETVSPEAFTDSSDERSIDSIFREFKKGVEEQLEEQDYETHYNLGIAYVEMELIDEAIGEFQVAAKDPGRFIDCCAMLGKCFREKGMPKLAVQWYKKGLENNNTSQDQAVVMLYDLGETFEESGDVEQALDTFTDVFGLDAEFRDVADKIQSLEDLLKS